MTIRSTDWFVCAGHVNADGSSGGMRGAVVTRIGVGHYRILMDSQIDESERAVLATIHEVVPNVGISTHEVSDSEVQVHTFTGGAAADHAFDFLIVRHSG